MITLEDATQDFMRLYTKEEALKDIDEFIRFVVDKDVESIDIGILLRIRTLLDLKDIIRALPYAA